jgi:integrase
MARRKYGTGSVSYEHRAGTCLDNGRGLHKRCTGRWTGSLSVGPDGLGRRTRKKVIGKTRGEVVAKLSDLRARETYKRTGYTVSDALDAWLARQHAGGSDSAQASREYVARHLYRTLGHLRLRDLSEADVTVALEKLGQEVADSHLRRIHTTLRRVIRAAKIEGLVDGNVANQVTVPGGQPGRRSKALTPAQADTILDEARKSRSHLYPYLLLCLRIGLGDREARALRWDDVDLDGDPAAEPPVPAHVTAMRYRRIPYVYAAPQKSPHGFEVDEVTVEALRHQRAQQARERLQAGPRWQDHGLVFTTRTGTPLHAYNLRRSFRDLMGTIEGINPADWTLRDLQHTHVAILAEHGVPMEEISQRVGHQTTAQTLAIYRDALARSGITDENLR